MSDAERVRGAKDWERWGRLLVEDVKAGRVQFSDPESYEGSDACEDACRNHGGVDLCGKSVVLCNDGTAWILPGI